MEKNSKIVIVENTVYSLLLYILQDKDWSTRNYVIIGNRIPIEIVNELSKKVNFLIFKSEGGFSTKNSLLDIIRIKKTMSYLREYINKHNVAHGNMDMLLNKKLRSGIRKVYIDDGLLTKELILQGDFRFKGFKGILKKIFYFLCSEKVVFNRDDVDYVLPIEYKKFLTNDFKAKTRFVDLLVLWSLKSKEEKSEILSIFCLDSSIINALISDDKNLLLTQPISEDGICSTDEKIKLYKNLIKKELNKKHLFIKPHPAETTDYASIFINATIIPKHFPCEFLFLLGIKFKKAVTLYSSAIEKIHSDERVFVGTKSLKKLALNLDGYRRLSEKMLST